MAPISLDDIEGPKAARLLKKKQPIDVQSNYHENDIKDTGEAADDLSGRIVRNRGPITAKIVASGNHGRYCEKGQDKGGCHADFSLVAWKFAGDEGTVHGSIEEKFADGQMLKVDVDCLVRDGKEAIVGGVITQIPDHFEELALNQRAYVKVTENSENDAADFISNVAIGFGLTSESSCKSVGALFKLGDEFNYISPHVSVCSKHTDWEGCLERIKAE
ncbi:hypothetical protein ACHAWO_002573 [Cyclotella atomus]|uniref:Uncharacterized protein n=1 Tax=Cyclotella atomus TaxID=382360 RepID=A0ABD3Q0B0_9STRA